jgi:hypothetical protein
MAHGNAGHGNPQRPPVDLAHNFASQPSTLATPPVQFAEPDLLQSFVYEPPPESREMFRFGGRVCEPGAPSSDWPSREEFAWHAKPLANCAKSSKIHR